MHYGVWAQDEVSPYGNFLITSVGRTEKTGRIRIINDMPDIGKYVLVSVHKVGYFADRPCIFSPKGCENAVFKEVADLRSESIMCLHYGQTLITPDSVIFDGVTLKIGHIVHEQFTESEYMLWTSGSGQGPTTFNDIGFQETVLHYFRFQYVPEGHNWVDNLFIQSINVLSDRKYLIAGNYHEYFCEKID